MATLTRAVLLTGDIGRREEEALAPRYWRVRAEAGDDEVTAAVGR